MAQDLGFFQVQFARQVFSPNIDAVEFAKTVADFAFIAERDDGRPLRG